MGAWGMTPFESDDFGDTFDRVTKSVGPSIFFQVVESQRKAVEGGDPQEIWTGVGLALWAFHTGALIAENLLVVQQRALEALDILARDEGWIASWKNPRAFRRVFKEVRDHVSSIDDDSPLTPTTLNKLFSTPR